MKTNKDVYYAKTISDVLYHLRSVAGIRVFSGCTSNICKKNSHLVDFGESSIIIRNIPELREITKTERYIEFGSAVTLAQILSIDEKKIPAVLHKAIRSIGNPYTANIATIGGNICTQDHKMTCYAPLLALDAKAEIREQNEAYFVPLSQFTKPPHGSFVTKIRVPTEDWDIELFKRIGGDESSHENASFAFLAATRKSMIADVRIAFCGIFCFRNKELENTLIGNKLPLSEKSVYTFSQLAQHYFTEYGEKNAISCPPVVQSQFSNLIFTALTNFM